MSLTVTKSDGVTVITLTSDPQSVCPPLCQMIKSLCWSPACCSVSQHLRRVQRTSQSLLGALHITVGLLNIGFGGILCINGDVFPFWLGGMFTLFGIISILSEKYPSPCLVVLNVILNLSGVGFAIAAIVLYSINIALETLWWMCDNNYIVQYNTPSPHEDIMMEKCLEGRDVALLVIRGINAVLVVLSVLELCVVISSAVLGIKALRSIEKKESKSTDDPGHYKRLPEEDPNHPSA